MERPNENATESLENELHKLAQAFEKKQNYEIADFIYLVRSGVNKDAKWSSDQKDLFLKYISQGEMGLIVLTKDSLEKATSIAAFINSCH